MIIIICVTLPIIIYFLNKNVDALITGEIHGRRGAIYSRDLNPFSFWLEFSGNFIISFALAVASLRAFFQTQKAIRIKNKHLMHLLLIEPILKLV